MTICSIDGCDRELGQHGARGWCPLHLQRFYTHGDPEKAVHRGQWMTGRKLTDANTWKGDRVGYGGAHERIVRLYGRPSRCDFCGKTGPVPNRARWYHWALSHDASRILVNTKGQAYSPEPSDYIRLCAPCHGRYDHLGMPRDFRTVERFG